jgi:hypothetical protein
MTIIEKALFAGFGPQLPFWLAPDQQKHQPK